MRILLTNDDGIYAPGLRALYQALRKIATITVVAPEHERSSVSHGITLFQPLWCKPATVADHFKGYALSGTPADCVKFGVRMILKCKPDLVVSGINSGENDGCSVFYSGTVAAAREGALLGIPSIAVSLATFEKADFSYPAQFSRRLVNFLQKNPLPAGTFLNVNVPNLPKNKIRGILLTRQGTEPIHTQFRKKSNPLDKKYFWMTGKTPTAHRNLATDTSALRQGYVVIAPLKCDQTDEETLAQWPRTLKI